MRDAFVGLFLLTLVVMIAGAYAVRVLRKGAAHFERVDHQGGSAFLGKRLKEMGYWCLQPLGRLLFYCGVSPNQVSWSSLLLGVVTAVCLAQGEFGIASVFLVSAGLLDALDGMLARMRKAASVAGEVLDSVLDRYVDFLFLSGLLFYYRFNPWLQALCLITILGSFMVSYSTAKAEALQVRIPPGGMRRPERTVYLFFGSVLSSLTIPLELVIADGQPLAYPMIVSLLIVGLISNLTAAHRFWRIAHEARRRREHRDSERVPELDVNFQTFSTVPEVHTSQNVRLHPDTQS